MTCSTTHRLSWDTAIIRRDRRQADLKVRLYDLAGLQGKTRSTCDDNKRPNDSNGPNGPNDPNDSNDELSRRAFPLIVEPAAGALETLVERAGDFSRYRTEAHPLRLSAADLLLGGTPA